MRPSVSYCCEMEKTGNRLPLCILSPFFLINKNLFELVFWTNKDVLVRLEERNRERVYFLPGKSGRKRDNAVAKINSKRKTAEAKPNGL